MPTRIHIRPATCPTPFPGIVVLVLTILALTTTAALGQEPSGDSAAPAVSGAVIVAPRPPGNVRGADVPNDAGTAIDISWDKSPDDGGGHNNVASYRILRATSPTGPFDTIGAGAPGIASFTDGQARPGRDFYYAVAAVAAAPNGVAAAFTTSPASPPARAVAQWFHTGRINALLAVVILCSAILWFITRAKSGRSLFIRKIAGLEAVDEAVGRATEMGRKIIFIPGIQDMDEVQTLAGITILGRVAKIAAEYEADLEVPTSRSLVMVACRETVKEAFLNAGRPDSYKEDRVYYLTDEQFGYAAAVNGLVVREKPAAMFFMGAFYAESLILAETANSIGAIQIAGTAMPSQLPFFVAACDYTLIGEELFAASAYLSKEPKLLGSLKGQDVGKGIILAVILLGILITSIGALTERTNDPERLGPYNLEQWFQVE